MSRHQDCREISWHNVAPLRQHLQRSCPCLLAQEGRAVTTRGRRGRPSISWRGSRAATTERGAATKRVGIPQSGCSEPPPVRRQRVDSGGESELYQEARRLDLRGLSGDGFSGQLVAGLPCRPDVHGPCVVNRVRRGGAWAPLLCGAKKHAVHYGRREALEAAVQADPRLRAAAAKLGGRPHDD